MSSATGQIEQPVEPSNARRDDNMSSGRTVDINSDMGEGFGCYRIGDDAALLDVITSANVACGFHAGDPEIMAATFRLAAARGVAVGAHPGYPDLWGFGRRRIPFSIGEIERLVAYQIGAAQALARYAGHRLTYVKAHGALGNLCETDAAVAGAVARAIHAVDPSLVCLSIARSIQIPIAADLGLQTRSEIFADRAYTDEGRLVPRAEPHAFVHDPEVAAERVARMVLSGRIVTLSGAEIATPIDSICVHSDGPVALQTARRVRARLVDAGVAVAPLRV